MCSQTGAVLCDVTSIPKGGAGVDVVFRGSKFVAGTLRACCRCTSSVIKYNTIVCVKLDTSRDFRSN